MVTCTIDSNWLYSNAPGSDPNSLISPFTLSTTVHVSGSLERFVQGDLGNIFMYSDEKTERNHMIDIEVFRGNTN